MAGAAVGGVYAGGVYVAVDAGTPGRNGVVAGGVAPGTGTIGNSVMSRKPVLLAARVAAGAAGEFVPRIVVNVVWGLMLLEFDCPIAGGLVTGCHARPSLGVFAKLTFGRGPKLGAVLAAAPYDGALNVGVEGGC